MSRNATSHVRPSGNRPALRTLLIALVAAVLVALLAVAGPIIKIRIGIPSQSCRGFGLCGISIESGTAAELSFDGAQTLTATFQEAPDQRGELFLVEEPIVLDHQTAAALGAKGLVILPGQ